MKDSKFRKFEDVYKDVDYSKIVEDLNVLDGFTEETLKQALKKQKPGVSIRIDRNFFREFVLPFTEKLKGGDLLSIKKIGNTRYYSISDREKAIRLLKPGLTQTQNTRVKGIKTGLGAGIGANIVMNLSPAPEKVKTPTIDVVKGLESLGVKGRSINSNLEVWVLILGTIIRDKDTLIESRKVIKNTTLYFGYRVQNKKPRALFNSLMKSLGKDIAICDSGKTRSSLLSVKGDSAENILNRYLFPTIEKLGDERLFSLYKWATGILDTIPKLVKRERKIEKVSVTEKPKAETNKPNLVTKTVETKVQAHWIITKFDLEEFVSRYSTIDSSVELHSPEGNLIKFFLKENSEDILKEISKECRNKEKLIQ